jgi:hypothetical protein
LDRSLRKGLTVKKLHQTVFTQLLFSSAFLSAAESEIGGSISHVIIVLGIFRGESVQGMDEEDEDFWHGYSCIKQERK